MTAPISPDVLTIPRKLPASVKTNIVGLTRDGLRAALMDRGWGEPALKKLLGANLLRVLKAVEKAATR